MSKKNKNDSFSFDNDPGKLSEEDDADFTFTDIPVLGNDKKKDLFSFDDLPNTEPDPSLASFEALLAEQPKGDGEETEDVSAFDATASTMDVQRVMKSRGAKKKKKMMIIAGSAGGVVAILIGVLVVMSMISSSPEEKEKKVLSPAEKAAIAKKKQKQKIAGMLKSANSLFESGEEKKALTSFKNILKLDRNLSDAYTGAGKCYAKLKNSEEAEKNYKKAIDLNSKAPAPYILLAEILINRKENTKALELLKDAHSKFPNDPKIAVMLGDIYYTNGESDLALEAYRAIKTKSCLSKDSIQRFGSLLENDAPKEAVDLYMFAGKKFKSSTFFSSAAMASDLPEEKIKVLTKALKILPDDDKNIDEIKFMLAQTYIKSGNKTEASATLQSINLTKLDTKQCSELIPLATASGIADIKSYCLKLLESNPKEISLQEAILKELTKSQTPEKLLGIYSAWWTSNTNEPVANYLYGLALGDSIAAKKYFTAAVALNPQFYEAILELAKINIKTNDLKSAVRNLNKAINLKKDRQTPHKLLAIAKIHQGNTSNALKEYSKFLETTKNSDSQKALQLLELALLLKTPNAANRYLAEIKKDPSMLREYRENNAKKKLIFGGASDSDFAGPKAGLMRKYYILYLLSKGREDALMRLRTSKKEFPEFWKIYLMRKKGMETWKTLAKLYYKKNVATADPAILLAVNMWLGNISIEDVEKQMNRISREKKGILYALIAEEYVRKKKMTKAIIRFKKAMRAPRSIYSGVINHIYNSLRKRR
jgi:Tfp pilus assembly protein PilF